MLHSRLKKDAGKILNRLLTSGKRETAVFQIKACSISSSGARK
jgi:hypothetical protein